MATGSPFYDRDVSDDKYRDCLIYPMGGKEGDPEFQFRHVVDAAIVAAIVFFSVLLGDVVFALGSPKAYLTLSEFLSRAPTAGIGFLLTFFAQLARARGIDVIEELRNIVGK